MNRSEGYVEIMETVKNTWDEYDSFGSNRSWAFALADYLWYWAGVKVDGYQPSCAHVAINSLVEESYELQELLTLEFEDEDAQAAYKILDRHREWLRLAGVDY